MSRMTYTPTAMQQSQSRAAPGTASGAAPGTRAYYQQQQAHRIHHHQRHQYASQYQQRAPLPGSHSQQQSHAQQQQQRSNGQAPPASKTQPYQQTWVDTLLYTLDALPPPATWPSHLVHTLAIQPLTFILSIITSPKTHRLLLRLSLLTTVFWTALALAVAAYIAFYNAWVPHLGLRVPVYLQYGDASAAPWADVFFDPPGRFFADDQQYDVTLELTVPLTPANLDLGNFMVSINMYPDSPHPSPAEPVISSSRPTLLHPSPSALNALSSFLSRNPNPDVSPFGISSPAGPVSSYSGPPLTLLSVPLLRRAVLQVSSSSSIPSSPSPPLSPKARASSSSLTRERTPSANGMPGQVGIKHPSQSVTRARIVVGRSDAERYWIYGGGHGGNGGNGAGSASHGDAFVSRGELQTHAVSLRFDAHLTGLRFFMYHYPLTSFFTFTSLFLICELGAAFFVAGIFALYSTLAASSIDVRSSDEAFVVPAREKRTLKTEDDEREGDLHTKRERAEDEDEEGDSLATTSSAAGTYNDDGDEEEDHRDDDGLRTPGIEEELDDLLLGERAGAGTPEERAYRHQMAARARTRMERAAAGGVGVGVGAEYEDSDDTEREEIGARRPATTTTTSTTSTTPSVPHIPAPTLPRSAGAAGTGTGTGTGTGGLSGERRVLGRLDEETEEETDQTATTTTTSRRATPRAGGTPVLPSSSSAVVAATTPTRGAGRRPAPAGVGVLGTPELGFGTEEEEEDDDEERRAERTRARWEAWRASQEVQPAVTAAAARGEGDLEGEEEHSPSASWESVGADDVEEEEEEEEEGEGERRAREEVAEAASMAEARRLKELELEAEGDGEGSGQAPIAGPSGSSRPGPAAPAPLPEATDEVPPVPSVAAAARAEDELSTATEEEGEEGAKTAG